MDVNPTPQPEVGAAGAAPLEITIVEANAADRRGTELVLRSWGHHVIGRAESSDVAFDLIGQRRPQVALVGMDVPDAGGIQLVRRLIAADPGLGVVLVFGQSSTDELDEAMACGARGIVLRCGAAAELAHAVVIVGAGGTYFAPAAERRARAGAARRPVGGSARPPSCWRMV